MRTRTLLVLGLVALLAGACQSVRTNFDYDPNANFGAWRTFAWYPGGPQPTGDPRVDSPLLHERVRAAVERVLAARGYRRVEDTNPDFFVNHHLLTEGRLQVRTMNRSYTAGPQGAAWAGAGWGGVGWSDTVVDQYDEGTLIIDMIDVAQRRLVWRGSGSRRLQRDPSPETVTRQVNQAVDEILARFPPGA